MEVQVTVGASVQLESYAHLVSLSQPEGLQVLVWYISVGEHPFKPQPWLVQEVQVQDKEIQLPFAWQV